MERTTSSPNPPAELQETGKRETATVSEALSSASLHAAPGEQTHREIGDRGNFREEAWEQLTQHEIPAHLRTEQVESVIRYLLSEELPVRTSKSTDAHDALVTLALYAMQQQSKELLSLIGNKLATISVPTTQMKAIAQGFVQLQENNCDRAPFLDGWIAWFSSQATDAVYDELMTGLAARVERGEQNFDHLVAVFARSTSPYAHNLWKEAVDVASVVYPVTLGDLPKGELFIRCIGALPSTLLMGAVTPLVAKGILSGLGMAFPTWSAALLGLCSAAWFAQTSLKESAIAWYREKNPSRPSPLATRIPEDKKDLLSRVIDRFEQLKTEMAQPE